MTIFRQAAAGLLLMGSAAAAQPFQDVAALDAQVEAALGAAIGEPGGAAAPVDRRLKLAACPGPVSIGAPAMGAVAVRCAELGWRIRVPLVRVRTAAVEEPEPIVRKGDQVELRAASGSFSVSTVAIAEEDGAIGDRIRVRTDRRSPALTGMIGPDGSVALLGFK